MLVLMQLPVPPVPPAPEAVVVSSGPPEAVFIAAIMCVGFIVAGIVLYPIVRAFARRLEGRGAGATDPMLLDRVADLEHRLAEAEERIDFNERMLAQREPLALPRDKAD